MAKHSSGIPQYLAAAVIVIAAISVAIYFALRSDEIARSEATLCPSSGSSTALVVLIDASGPMSDVQARAARTAILNRLSELPIDTLVSILAVSPLSEKHDQVSRCRPPQQQDVDRRVANPRLAQVSYDENFLAPITAQLDDAIAAAVALGDRSDIIRGARALGATNARDTGSEILLTVSEAISFEIGSFQISDAARLAMQEVGSALALRPELELRITGHTDSTGLRNSNIVLSQKRAEAVAAMLQDLGVRPEALQSVGLGPDAPLADNATDAGQAANRRVEILIVSKRPIAENLQAAMVEARGHLAPSAKVEVVLVTDLLQNSEAFSVYSDMSWSDFEATPAYQRLGDGLKEADVTFLRIGRAAPEIKDFFLVVDFWRNYVSRQGGRIVSDRTIGDL